MLNTIVMIGAGGALGAISRHGVNVMASHVMKMSFPFGTLAVNVIGCFLMGILVAGFVNIWNPPQEVKVFLTTGFLGAFTTFSTFSLDAMALWTRGDVGGAAVYVLASVVLSLCAIVLGHYIIGKVLA